MTMLTPARVRHIFEGNAWRARLESPNYDLQECEIIASEIIDAAGRPTDWANPIGMALGLRYRPIPVRVGGCGREVCDSRKILYRPDANPRVQGLPLFHGIAHNWTAARYPDANEAAVWIVTGALVVPHKYRLWTVEQVMSKQKHAPQWFVESRVFLLWADGPFVRKVAE
jgi:hypothetical protein